MSRLTRAFYAWTGIGSGEPPASDNPSIDDRPGVDQLPPKTDGPRVGYRLGLGAVGELALEYDVQN